MIPTSIDGTDIGGATIDGTDVQEITVDGDTVFTAGPTVIDDFNDGNLTEYSGNVGAYDTTTSPVFEGSHALENLSSFQVMFRTDFVSPGDVVNVRVRGGNHCGFFFGFDGTDGYKTTYRPQSADLSIERITGGSNVDDVVQSVTGITGKFVRLRIEYTVGSLKVELFDGGTLQDTVTKSDSTHSNTGFGFRLRDDSFADFVTIE